VTNRADTSATPDNGQGIRWVRQLALVNLGLVALQSLSAGFFLSGYGQGVTAHATGALALQCGVLVQAAAAAVLWRRRRAPARVAGLSLGLLVIVLMEAGLGHNKRFWLHVPLGVALFGGLTRQVSRLDALRDGTRGLTKREAGT
jgi:hypothetical protein